MILFVRLAFFLGYVCILGAGIGCTSVNLDSSQLSFGKNPAFGVLDVQSDGPNPRRYPTKLRFFFVTNMKTQETHRIDVSPDSRMFFLTLPPGKYSVERVQFHEGPFMAESYLRFEFTIPRENAAWLGVWKFQVQTPRTIRLVHAQFVPGDPELSKKLLVQLTTDPTDLKTVLPAPDSVEARVFTVAPLPRARYFYR